MTVLYIDDDDEDREIFKEALTSIAPYHTLLAAQDSDEAFKVLKKRIPDYIFLDINLPGMNGKEILTTIKKSKRLNRIPAIMLTTSRNPEDSSECKSLGAIDFISKPSLFHELCEALKRYL